MSINAPLNRKLRMGLIGGHGGFIGRVHVIAAVLDQRATLVAGALSSDPAKAKAAAPEFGIAADRAYGSYQEMIDAEMRLPDGDRIDFASIATPNDTHFAIAKALVQADFNVLCDKPLASDVPQAEEMAALVRDRGVVFAVTHNYTGYPLVRQAREMVRGGELGEINAVRAGYIQGSLRKERTPDQQQRFAWKTDPARAGISGCFGDIGIHAYNLVRFVTGLAPTRVAAQLCVFEPVGRLDDYGTATLDLGAALATITASRISHGHENDLWLEVDGTKASLQWRQETPNALLYRVNGLPHRVYTRAGGPYLGTLAGRSTRIPAGHPEGFLEAFANVYTAVFDDIIRRATGEAFAMQDTLYPNVTDGVDGVRFVAACVASSRDGGWGSLV